MLARFGPDPNEAVACAFSSLDRRIVWRQNTPMISTLAIVKAIAFGIYAAPHALACLALSFAASEKTSGILRNYTRVGPILGLAMGACIAAALAELWMTHQAFPLFEVENLPLTAAFLVLWISNIKLEIWTLEPIRKSTDWSPTAKAMKSLTFHLWFHFIALGAVCGISQL